MGSSESEKKVSKKSYEKKLPRLLRRFEKADFEKQLRARFLYYLIFSLMLCILFIMFYTSYLNITSSLIIENFFINDLLPQLVLFGILFVIMWILVKDHYWIASHLLLIAVLSAIWFVIWMARSEFLSRLDTVVLLMAGLSILPLLVDRKGWVISVYVGANIFIMVLFLLIQGYQLNIPKGSIIEYLCDVTIAFVFIGIVSTSIYNIYRRTHQKAVADFNDRIVAEQARTESEIKYREITEMLPQTVFETDIKGRLTFVNHTGLNLFGISQKDLDRGTSVFLGIAKKDRLRSIENFNRNIETGELVGAKYTGLKRDGTLFPIEIYSKPYKKDDIVAGIRGIIIDRTEMEEADRIIKESEERFRALMESMNEAIIVADNNHVVQYINKRFTEQLGYTLEDVVGKVGIYIFHDKEEQRNLVEEANRARLNNSRTAYELTFIAKDGHKVDFLVSGAPYRNTDGEIIGSIGALTDITERKKADKALNESRQQFQTLAEMSPVGIFRTRPDGYTTYVNPKWCEISGLTPEEAVGDGWIKAVHPDDVDWISGKWNSDAPRSEKSIASYRFLKPDGSISWVLGNAVPEIIDGELRGYIGTITNITDLKLAQKELEESESRYRAIIEAFPDILLITDASGKIHYMNEVGQRTTGITPEHFSNPTAVARIHPEDFPYVSGETLDLLKSDKQHSGIIENRFIDASGNIHWFSGIMSRIVVNGQTMLQTITRDITEKKAIEQEIEKYRNHLEQLVHDRTAELADANKMLKTTNEELELQREELQTAYDNLRDAQAKLVQAEKMASLGVLAAGIAHEINNPLNFINGGAYALEGYISEHLKDHMNEVSPLIEGIQVGVQRAAEIVSSLNLYSRRDDLPGTECDLHSIIDNCLVMLNNELRHRIEVTKHYKADRAVVFGNGGRFHQVFLNVLTNAIHAIKDKGNINIFTSVKKNHCVVVIEDDGCGISREVIHKITDPFFTTKDPGKGTGLGLSITYNILKDYKGTIEFESEEGKGTKVIITLPLMK